MKSRAAARVKFSSSATATKARSSRVSRSTVIVPEPTTNAGQSDYAGRVRARLAIAAIAVLTAGCGDDERDQTQTYVGCLTAHGGVPVHSAAQLAAINGRAETGGSFSWTQLSYSSAYLPGDRGLVVMHTPGLRQDRLTEEQVIDAARVNPSRFRAVVLLPRARDPLEIAGDCLDQVVPDWAEPPYD